VTSEADSTLDINILDAGLTDDVVATDKFAIAILDGGTSMYLPTGTWTKNFFAPAGWDVSGADILYSNNVEDWTGDATFDRVIYITGLVRTLALVGDADENGVVNAADYMALKRHMGMGSGAVLADGDFDTDQDVDFADLQLLIGNYDAVQTGAGTIPEPATLFVLLAAGLPALLKRRRSRS